jgi:phospholipid transport system transporter-binding protein
VNVLDLPKELTHAQANACLAQLMNGLRAESGPDVLVNATPLNRFDSAALAVLLEFRRQTLALGKRFSIHGLPDRLGNLATLYGIMDLLPSDALSALPPLSPVK